MVEPNREKEGRAKSSEEEEGLISWWVAKEKEEIRVPEWIESTVSAELDLLGV